MSFFKEIKKFEYHRVDANKDYELVDIIFLVIALYGVALKAERQLKYMVKFNLNG